MKTEDTKNRSSSVITRPFAGLIGAVQPVYERLNQISGGRLGILRTAAVQYQINHSYIAAASIAFYTVFSLFPLIAVIVWVLGLVLNEQTVVALLIQAFKPLVPFSSALISQNIERLASSKGAFGVVGLVGLVWTAANVFGILSHYVNVAWERTRARSLFYRRMIGVGIVMGMVFILIVFILIIAMVNIVTQFRFPIFGIPVTAEESPWGKGLLLLQPLLLFVIFFLIYRWLPNTPVKFKEAFWPALVVTGMWELTAALFGAYLRSGVVNYDLLYGSLGAVVILMIWFYFNSAMVIFGAHLSAAIAQSDQKMRTEQTNQPGGMEQINLK